MRVLHVGFLDAGANGQTHANLQQLAQNGKEKSRFSLKYYHSRQVSSLFRPSHKSRKCNVEDSKVSEIEESVTNPFCGKSCIKPNIVILAVIG